MVPTFGEAAAARVKPATLTEPVKAETVFTHQLMEPQLLAAEVAVATLGAAAKVAVAMATAAGAKVSSAESSARAVGCGDEWTVSSGAPEAPTFARMASMAINVIVNYVVGAITWVLIKTIRAGRLRRGRGRCPGSTSLTRPVLTRVSTALVPRSFGIASPRSARRGG